MPAAIAAARRMSRGRRVRADGLGSFTATSLTGSDRRARLARGRARGVCTGFPRSWRARISASRLVAALQTLRSRSALRMTETELMLIAAAAIIGLRNDPVSG